jgi:carbamoyltransferase
LFFHNLIKIPEVLKKQGFSGNFVWLNHHDYHAASAFFVTYYKEAQLMVLGKSILL